MEAARCFGFLLPLIASEVSEHRRSNPSCPLIASTEGQDEYVASCI